ncbi:MAG: sialate O-acetylesterase, partial [Armatimonadota bacterium]
AERSFARAVVVALLCSLIGAPTVADVKVPAIIGDNMVLQRGVKVPIWGTADGGESVTVRLGERRKATVADENGRWLVKFGPLSAGGPYELRIAGANTVTLKNVLVGEVWVCSGQSNMQWPLQASRNAKEEIAAANYPNIRLFTVGRVPAEEQQRDVQGEWVQCSPSTVPGFSAVAYFFGRDLHEALGVPIGLIHTSWGGTPAEAWTSRPALEAEPKLQPLLERWEKALTDLPKFQAEYDAKVAKWQEALQKAKAEGRPAPRRPRPPWPLWKQWRPASLYNGMIAPLIPYAIRGAIWYQGESNAGRAYEYRALFKAMIRDWRRNWKQGPFPFLFVQLANFMARKPEPGESAWAELREAQLRALSLPNTGMAVIIDIGEARDIHPKNKQDVGARLALAARKIAYGEDIVHSGPIYDSMKVEGGKIRLRFKHVDGGLTAKGSKVLKGFAIAGADRKFVWANAAIRGDTVIVWSHKVPHPVAVRYAWADNPECNLYNAAGLPASPFRTDDWPGVTVGKH